MKTLAIIAMLLFSAAAHAEFNVEAFEADLVEALEEGRRAADIEFAPPMERFKADLEAVREIYQQLETVNLTGEGS